MLIMGSKWMVIDWGLPVLSLLVSIVLLRVLKVDCVAEDLSRIFLVSKLLSSNLVESVIDSNSFLREELTVFAGKVSAIFCTKRHVLGLICKFNRAIFFVLSSNLIFVTSLEIE